MADLYISFAFMLGLCSVLLAVGVRCARWFSPAALVQVLGIAVVLMSCYLMFLWNQPIIASLIPSSAIIVLGNWLPLFGTFFAGVCAGTRRIHVARRAILTVVTVGLCTYSLFQPMSGSSPTCLRLNGSAALQFQTADTTCSPVSGACLLRLHGIAATEWDMAPLCLTREGTHWMGLYRGMKLKVQNTEWDVVVEPFSLDRLKAGKIPRGPAVLSLSFNDRFGSQSLATGFSEIKGHSVVLLDHSGSNTLQIFDPSPEFGFESWDESILSTIQEGVMIRLVPRNPTGRKLDLEQIIVAERSARR